MQGNTKKPPASHTLPSNTSQKRRLLIPSDDATRSDSMKQLEERLEVNLVERDI